MVKLPHSTFERILRESAKGIRVSDGAAQTLIAYIEEIAKSIGRDAAELARHAGRKTITDADVKLAIKRRD
jgi:histone H3/H4